MPIERQMSKLIKSSNCTFKEHGNTLNVIEVNKITILSCNGGDFGEWNTKFSGYAELTTVTDDGINKCSATYNIEGYAKIQDDVAINIDKTISVGHK